MRKTLSMQNKNYYVPSMYLNTQLKIKKQALKRTIQERRAEALSG